MKLKFKNIIISIVIVLIIYFTGTPKGALRLSLFVNGFPENAIHIKLKNNPYKDSQGMIIYTLSTPPFEKSTGMILENWAAKKLGIVYVGLYYGY